MNVTEEEFKALLARDTKILNILRGRL